jgi:2-oxoisovalerate dehydrogenase E2 component (dihydrolipoyl transacylase)
MAATGKPLVDIETDDTAAAAAVASHTANAASSNAVPTPTTTPATSAPACPQAAAPASTEGTAGKIPMTPAVRAMLHREKIDPSQVPATGKGGRLLKDDLVRFLETPKAPTPVNSVPVNSVPVSTTSLSSVPVAAAADRVEPVTGIRRAMAKAMTQSMKIPHFGYCDEIVLNRLMATRELLKPVALERGIKLSFMPFMLKVWVGMWFWVVNGRGIHQRIIIILFIFASCFLLRRRQAASLALLQYPVLNSHVLDDECSAITYKGDHNIGVAMATAQGLMVPNIKQIQLKSIFEIAADLNALQVASLCFLL